MSVTCISLELDIRCPYCKMSDRNHQIEQCWIAEWAEEIGNIDEDGLKMAYIKVHHAPISTQCLLLAIKHYHPQYLQTIEKLSVLI